MTHPMPINIKAKSFRPTDFNPNMLISNAPSGGALGGMYSIYVPNEKHIAWQKLIDSRIEEARTKN